jgi:transcriptional antiterminator RfaH
MAELCSQELAWYCVRSHLKHEHIVAAHFERVAGLEVFNPQLRLLRSTRGGRRRYIESLFPNYVFARFVAETTLEKIRFSPGVKCVVRFGNRVPAVPDTVIAELRKGLAELSGKVLVDTPLEGQEVEIALGPFAGHKGHVIRVLPSQERVQILLQVMGRSVTAELSLEEVLFNRKAPAGLALNDVRTGSPGTVLLTPNRARVGSLGGVASLLACICLWLEPGAQAQQQESTAGEQAAQELKKSIAAEQYSLSNGPVKFKTETSVALGYTDNLFYCENDLGPFSGSYMALITLGLNSAVGRYLTIALEHENPSRANLIFKTSFWGSIALTTFLFWKYWINIWQRAEGTDLGT